MNRAQIKSIVALPLVVAGIVPIIVLIFTPFSIGWGIPMPFAALLVLLGFGSILIGFVLLGVTIRLFDKTGNGTLAPWDPPKNLVAVGIYQYVRNPMITGVLCIVLGESLFFGSWSILVLFGIFLVLNLTYIPLSEEKGLIKRFGDDYLAYMRTVPRWIPSLKAWHPLVNYLTGHYPRSVLKKRVLPTIVTIIFAFLLIAYLFYPPALNYSFFSDTISGLGDFVENPNGWWGFSIAIWTLSTSFFSLFLYMHRRLEVICRKTARFGSFFALTGCICLFFIGFIVDANAPLIGSLNFSRMHMIFVYGGFGGLAIALVTYGVIFIKDSLPRFGGQQLIPRWRPFAPYAIIFGLAIGMGISQLIEQILFPNDWNGPGLLSVSLWEWMLLFGIITWVFWTVLLLPEDMPLPRNAPTV